MQASYPESFEREVGSTEADWLRRLPEAIGAYAWQQPQPGEVRVLLPPGQLLVRWQVAAPRVLGLARLPRLTMQFVFSNLSDAERLRFMRRFDLYMQRGGG